MGHEPPPWARISVAAHVSLISWVAGFDFGLLYDPLSLTWTLIITGVGFLIVTYAIGYMEGDGAYARFFAYMNFFVFAMLTLVLSDNFVGLLVGWGGVGLASFFLIGFYINRPTAVAAARKAFVLNVVGDVGIMFAVFEIYTQTSSISLWRRRCSPFRATSWCRRAALLLVSASASSSVPRRSRRRFRCTRGSPMRWKVRPRSPR